MCASSDADRMMPDNGDNKQRDRARQILLNDWDPHNAANNLAAHGTYDAYIDPLLELIRSGGSEDDLIHFLRQREAETMCFPGLGIERLRPVARKLLALRELD